MSTLTPALQGNFRIKYGPWIDALPEIDTIASMLPFQPKEYQPGEKYRVPFLAGIEHGQTASRAGGLFNLNKPKGAEVPYAELDGSTIIMRAQYALDDVYASLNGQSNGAYQDVMSLKMKAKGMGASLYRDLALSYGPGAGSVLAANIGVVSTTATAVNTSPSVRLTKASFIPGLWPSMKNALVDIYQSDGTTLRAGNVQVLGLTNNNKTQVKFGVSTVSGEATVNPAAVVTAGDIIVPQGWKGGSCIGIEAMANTQTGTIFTVDLTNIPIFRWSQFDAAAGPLTRKLIREWGARASQFGCKQGGVLKVAASAFAGLAEEFSALNRDTSMGGVKKQGETALVFETPAGLISVEVWELAKQSQAIFFAKSANGYRVGATDNTMRPIKGINEAFLTPLIDQPGLQSMMYSNQAPFFDRPWHNFIVSNIVSPGDVPDAA